MTVETKCEKTLVERIRVWFENPWTTTEHPRLVAADGDRTISDLRDRLDAAEKRVDDVRKATEKRIAELEDLKDGIKRYADQMLPENDTLQREVEELDCKPIEVVGKLKARIRDLETSQSAAPVATSSRGVCEPLTEEVSDEAKGAMAAVLEPLLMRAINSQYYSPSDAAQACARKFASAVLVKARELLCPKDKAQPVRITRDRLQDVAEAWFSQRSIDGTTYYMPSLSRLIDAIAAELGL